MWYNYYSRKHMRSVKKQIKEIAAVILGHTFRASPEVHPDGKPYRLIQVKDIDHNGVLYFDQFEAINYKFSREVELVRAGDIIFCPREHKLVAALVDKAPQQATIVSAPLIIIRTSSQELVNPGYLQSYLNSGLVKREFQNLLSGSFILAIKKTELADFDVLVPSLEKQEVFSRIYHYSEQARGMQEKLLELKSKERSSLINKSFKQLLGV